MAALIFDVDGTLAETEEAHRHAFNAAFAAAGLAWSWDPATYARLLKTTGGKERIAAWLGELGPGAPPLSTAAIAALHADKTRRYVATLAAGGLDLRPGVRALIDAARAADLSLAIATTTSRPNVEALCRACWGRDAADVFDVIAAGDEVARKKPAPDVYLLALERLAMPAAQCVALEDSRNGLLSAKAAGLRVVAAPGLYTAGESLAEADLVVADLEAITLARLTALFTPIAPAP